MNKSIDDIMADKIISMINYLLAKKIKPDIKIDNVNELSDDELNRLKKIGIKGIILDVDETIRSDMKMIPLCNQKWLEKVKKDFKIIVVSNGMDRNIEEFFKLQNIDYIGFAHKPLKKNFRKACDMMDLKPEEILVIGDEIFTDIYGGKRNNMMTAWIKGKVREDEEK